ncbi:MAG: DUF4278 domain-containing protein [Hydrococcus sp. C42_A2020_068]|uniref:DUF4278 domain-containing protein n=1 Tax=Pleurocapsa sp. PCC 7327 TaxID=118163 RepID=UPI00029FEFC5|nr:DUF4278 domain-containing protein [Pleurocapsa sp. PCC 7327]AFY79140.1 hypothetical protein Ple7327_3997 [Pleurocapsa sp. PCC 7327]MBF2020747.1 DUF4278 domain-containing protein [Hydrococcus sp. C42_A2020_068]
MKLYFLGLSYHCFPLSIDTINSGITGKFRGGTYKIRCPIVASPLTVKKLKYRGIAY